MADYEDDYDEDMDVEGGAQSRFFISAPNSLNGLRACIPCLLVKTYKQFHDEGCENCSAAFELKEDDAKIADVTTPSFEGLVALTQPEASWVAKWQFLQRMHPGVYAIKVQGEVSPETDKELEDAGLPNIGKMLQKDVVKKPV